MSVFLSPKNETSKLKPNYYPTKQTVVSEYLNSNMDYIYSTYGQLIEIRQNNEGSNQFYVQINEFLLVKIDLNNSNSTMSSELGYLSRILAAESLTAQFSDYSKNISMYTRVCVAQTIRNRKNSNIGTWSKYKTYRDIILKTGYATSAYEFKETEKWLEKPIALKRFTEEVLPVAIFVFFNKTDFTNNAVGFYTPAKTSDEIAELFTNTKTIEIKGVDPYYEFTFWKF